MFGSRNAKNAKKPGPRSGFGDLLAQLRPDLSPESLGVGPSFPGIAPNPLLSGAARRRTAELRGGSLALGVLVGWREVSNEGSPRVVLIFDTETADGLTFRGVADETLTITELTRLVEGQTLPVRYRPAVQDHYVALARDADPAEVQWIADQIARRRQA
ncbi:hypothetical protein GCM10027515_17420 [Schumannella luteola]|nr:hypothetical protein [Schumannella luteola]TPX02305.1 hypothetical protein FJ656_23090 [Schumannella luteola]